MSMSSVISKSIRAASAIALSAALSGLVSACSTQPASPVSSATAAISAPIALSNRVHRYASSETGIFANGYLVDVDDGLVAIDATLTVSDATAYRKLAESLHKPLLAVLITHGHPDHYNGTTILTAGNPVPVYATATVDKVIREWDGKKEKQWKPVFKDEWPDHRTFPNHVIANGDTIRFGALSFTVHDVGPGESHDDTYWIADDGRSHVAFIGDIAFNGVHSYMSDGHSAAWLENLKNARPVLEGAARLYPGHGEPGGMELLAHQAQYLTTYREAVRRLADGHTTLTDDQKKQLTATMEVFLPSTKLNWLIPLGADAVASEIASEPGAQ